MGSNRDPAIPGRHSRQDDHLHNGRCLWTDAQGRPAGRSDWRAGSQWCGSSRCWSDRSCWCSNECNWRYSRWKRAERWRRSSGCHESSECCPATQSNCEHLFMPWDCMRRQPITALWPTVMNWPRARRSWANGCNALMVFTLSQDPRTLGFLRP